MAGLSGPVRREKNISQIQVEAIKLPGALDAPLEAFFIEEELTNPQFGIDWLSNLSAHALDPGDRALILVARRGERDLVALPILLKKKGRTAMALSTFYTSIYRPLIRSEEPVPLLTALFRHLAREERATELILMPMDLDEEGAEQLTRAQRSAGWRGIHRYFCFGNWVHDIHRQDYQQYLASRPSRLRNTIRRRAQKFSPGEPGELRVIAGSARLEEAIEDFNTVYANSWKVDEPYPEFIPSLVRLAATRGWLRLGVASYNNIPVASQIWLVHNGTAYIYKLAYDENYKSLSPGTVLTAFMFEHVMGTDHVTRIDYLSGDDVYKRDWMSTRYERHGTAAFNPGTLRGCIKLLKHKVTRMLKRRSSPLAASALPAATATGADQATPPIQ